MHATWCVSEIDEDGEHLDGTDTCTGVLDTLGEIGVWIKQDHGETPGPVHCVVGCHDLDRAGVLGLVEALHLRLQLMPA